MGRLVKVAMVAERTDPFSPLVEATFDDHGRHIADLSAALARRGHDVVVYTCVESQASPGALSTARGFRLVRMPAGPVARTPTQAPPHLSDCADFLRAEWQRCPPDLVHGHYWTSGLVALLAVAGSPIATAQTFHSLGLATRGRAGPADVDPARRVQIERIIGRRVGHVLATGSDEARTLAGMGVPRTSTSVVPNGVDLARFTPEGRSAKRGARHRVLCVARVTEQAGLSTLVDALTLLPDTELVIAGSSDDQRLRHALLRRAQERDVADRVHLVGPASTETLPALLRSADIVACVPWREQVGDVALEAMACGVPVLASAVGGLNDTVIDGITGVHVPPKNSRALADRLRGLLANDSARIAMGIAGADRVRVRYGWDRIAAETERAYRSASPAQ